MKKTELEKLKKKILGMDPVCQLELSNLLVSELGLNNVSLKDLEYDKHKSDEVTNFLHLLINNLEDEVDKERLLLLINEIKELPSEYQNKLVTRLINLILRLQKEYHHESILKECENNNHILSEWKKITWTTKAVVWDAGPQGYVDVEKVRWERSCSRCGYIEKVDKEPTEVREARLEAERQEEIKVLEKRLSKLKNNQ